MKALVEYLAGSLVDKPEAVVVTEKAEGASRTFYLTVSREDLGKVIGKKGRTAKAIRILLSAAAAQKNERVILDILEPKADTSTPPAIACEVKEEKPDPNQIPSDQTEKA
jgi:predicted RNA-binding protein YlqC (UPF0109 family)